MLFIFSNKIDEIIFYYQNFTNISGLPRNKVCIVMEALLWHIFIQGLLQPSIALIVSLVLCPIASLVVFIGEYFAFCHTFVNII